jgi:hypothetical protein
VVSISTSRRTFFRASLSAHWLLFMYFMANMRLQSFFCTMHTCNTGSYHCYCRNLRFVICILHLKSRWMTWARYAARITKCIQNISPGTPRSVFSKVGAAAPQGAVKFCQGGNGLIIIHINC